jgi:hypothetical protein
VGKGRDQSQQCCRNQKNRCQRIHRKCSHREPDAQNCGKYRKADAGFDAQGRNRDSWC